MSIKTYIKSILADYKHFQSDKSKFYTDDIKYYNFWNLDNSASCWFTQFINYRNLNIHHKKINFLSVMGSPFTSFLVRAPKIFFTGENIFNSDYYTPYNRFRKHYLKNINLSLGFSYTEHSKYLRFPLWILYIIPPDSNLESIRNILDKYNDRSFRLTTGRENFCSNISRLDNIGIRKTMIDLINPIEEVKCAGDFMKNTDDLQKKYGDDKIEYLKNFKFNICPENSDTPGYVTEKLFEAIISGCIPLYWGSNNVPESEIINQNSILFYDSKNPKALFDKVQLLWNDENAYKNFCAIKPFKDDAAEVIWELLNSLESKLRKVI